MHWNHLNLQRSQAWIIGGVNKLDFGNHISGARSKLKRLILNPNKLYLANKLHYQASHRVLASSPTERSKIKIIKLGWVWFLKVPQSGKLAYDKGDLGPK